MVIGACRFLTDAGVLFLAPDSEVVSPFDMLQDEGIRRFMLEAEALYPTDAARFTIADQRRFYDELCRHFRRARPSEVDVQDFHATRPGGAVQIGSIGHAWSISLITMWVAK